MGVTIQLGTEGAAAEKPLTIIDLFHRTVTENGGSVALAYKRAGQWREINYTQYYEMSITIAKAFIKVMENDLFKFNYFIISSSL